MSQAGMHYGADAAELAKFDALAHRFWDPRGEFRPLHSLNPVRAQFIAGRVRLPGARVLDVGCGGGLLAEALADAGASVTAIDLAPSMIEVARLHALERGVTIDYRVMGAEALLAAGEPPYDIVTCMEMLEHVPDPAALIGCFARLLRPGGELFISTINRNAKSFALGIVAAEYVLRLLPRGTHEYARFIRPSELAAMARPAGCTLIDLAGIAYDPFSGRSSLTTDTAVNYLAHLRREGGTS
ncbi:MAG TPA: bifunctional 2-polyprenyl-6-hydroxyphenol methylase/3-demethylubiquinol 3-O-methyltransferase UbiG [Steroidobacteraceae bacterium]|jgi:2-polyprenyl-6-hydroxyphenyl methylase/3-demethylubiquinone-9 3-methyltransferase|nr:bifunctional 2-polyprenyl-6-hydroxyphenol methylase/3-demethylubiquinol 3-O-methyltransferase UbiG [Steroidobacteraceae bacterium]HNS27957.1 bifunctional 2-polyprenyl-6-hydroxyphenol methylase/3-demethylubiquinol 3-O-methyltransferase UbiG [Steroidobacteraceae bacterium]